MATARVKPESPLIVIVGPTASGKTALAIALARQYDGEIVCADSRTIYKGMDIGTAKPTTEEQAYVPHWGLDLVEPGQRFTVADFQRYALEKIGDIRRRGKVPFLVGGTGLYVDSVIFEYEFGDDRDFKMRPKFESQTLDELIKYCIENNISVPENNKNKRYVIRAIEQKTINNRRRDTPISNSIIVGIATDRDVLRARITQRSEHIFADGVVEEARKLGKKYGWESEAMTGNIYRLVHQYVDDEITMDEMKRIFSIRDWQLAKRQLTWLKRNAYIKWLPVDRANKFLSERLENWRQS